MTTALARNGADHGADGRFTAQNRAAARHGLFARSTALVGRRRRRSGRLLQRLQELVELREVDLPAARAWAEMEVLAADAFAALQADREAGRPWNVKLLAEYRGLRRDGLLLAREMGMTPRARLELAGIGAGSIKDAIAARRQADALAAADELRRTYVLGDSDNG